MTDNKHDWSDMTHNMNRDEVVTNNAIFLPSDVGR